MAQNNTSQITINKTWKLDKGETIGKVHMAEIDNEWRILDFRNEHILYNGSKENGSLDSIFYKIEENVITFYKEESKSKPKSKIDYSLYLRIDSLTENQLILILGGKRKKRSVEGLKLTYSLIE